MEDLRPPSKTNQRISWQCQTCGGDLDDSDGWLTVYRSHVVEAEKANDGCKRTYHGTPTGFPSLRVLNILPQPGIARWAAYHHACDPSRDDALYSISIDNLRNEEQILGWTLHFMDTKAWIEHTDWTQTVRRQLQFNQAARPDGGEAFFGMVPPPGSAAASGTQMGISHPWDWDA